MPDTHRAVLGLGCSHADIAMNQSERLTRMEHDHAAWLRFCEARDLMRNALGDIEMRHPGDLAECDAMLSDIDSNVTGIVGDVVRWAGVR